MDKKNISKKVIGAVVGALTGGIGGYFLGARQARKEMAVEFVEELEPDVMAAAEAVVETATTQA